MREANVRPLRSFPSCSCATYLLPLLFLGPVFCGAKPIPVSDNTGNSMGYIFGLRGSVNFSDTSPVADVSGSRVGSASNPLRQFMGREGRSSTRHDALSHRGYPHSR